VLAHATAEWPTKWPWPGFVRLLRWTWTTKLTPCYLLPLKH